MIVEKHTKKSLVIYQLTVKKEKGFLFILGVIKYFPDALAELAKVSLIGNDQHHPDKPLHWDRSKSTDELDALARHLVEAGKIDTDGVRHSAKVAWRAMANLQKELENSNERDEQWYIDQYNRNRS